MKSYFLILCSLLILIRPASGAWINTSASFGGQVRAYRTYVPVNYDPSKPAALIVVLHGLGGSMNDAASVGITDVADTANIILLSPQALDYNSPLGVIEAAWNSGVAVTIPGMGTFAVNADVDDVGFIQSMMDTAMVHYSIRQERTYVCGASMGGFMTQRLACEAANRFAAVASVMGTYAKALPPCNPGKILPVAHFHGTNDEVVSYNGDLLFAGNVFPVGLSVDTLMAQWVTRNQCTPAPQHDTWPDSNQDNFFVEHFTYSDLQGRSGVELFKVNGGTHAWYQGAGTGGEVDYATEIWKFFNKQYGYTQGTSITAVNNILADVKVYPNPASNRLFVQAGIPLDKIILTDVFGKAIPVVGNTAEGLDIRALPAGVYLARITDIKGGRTTVKFIKQ